MKKIVYCLGLMMLSMNVGAQPHASADAKMSFTQFLAEHVWSWWDYATIIAAIAILAIIIWLAVTGDAPATDTEGE